MAVHCFDGMLLYVRLLYFADAAAVFVKRLSALAWVLASSTPMPALINDSIRVFAVVRQALRQLLRRPENGQCADCSGGGRSAWASINCGVFICLSCAGLHRGLGVHISQARPFLRYQT